jgi:carbonic anhydrase/acetyltransferase-like protein (isoleucine patch superfamily)
MDSRQYEFEGASPEIDGNAHVSRESTLVGST